MWLRLAPYVTTFFFTFYQMHQDVRGYIAVQFDNKM